MMRQFDVIVIGGGILGCFAARNLKRWKLSVLLLEAVDDVCTGITRANSAIVYAGYDNKPGSRKAEMTVRGNADMDRLCQELEVPFRRCGSLLVTYGEASVSRLQRKLQNGIQNGVPGVRLLSGPEAETMEPMLQRGVAAALYAPSTGVTNPWQLGIAAYENALQNGAVSQMNTTVTGIRAEGNGYILETTRGEYGCRGVVNCAGLSADQVQALLFPPKARLRLDGAEYLVMDERARKPERVIFLQSERCGKGITAIPCVEGNLLISGIRKPMDIPFATTPEGLRELRQSAQALLPGLETAQIIRSFGAVRPNPYTETGESLHDFCVEHPAPGFYSLIGIKTPGLTCANELGLYLARLVAEEQNAGPNPDFNPHRPFISQKNGKIICQCGQITEGEIREAIARGATTVDGVKRRVGTGMGRCQGARCTWEIEKQLEAARHGAL